MTHDDHVALLRGGIPGPGGVWADLLGPSAEIYAVDADERALRQAAQAMQARFPAVTLRTVTGDFTRPLDLPPLDGIVMANSLHFVRHKAPVLTLVRDALVAGGRLILVEYNTDRGNAWVPHPLAYPTWAALAGNAGFAETRLLTTRPSRFLGEIYAALSLTA